MDGPLGFAAGVMLAASFTSPILPGIEVGGLAPVVVGLFLGVVLLDQTDRWVPHVHVLVTGRSRPDQGAGDPAASSPLPDERVATLGTMVGLGVMLYLDVALEAVAS